MNFNSDIWLLNLKYTQEDEDVKRERIILFHS